MSRKDARQELESAMYAIAFDLKIDELRASYGEPYNNAYAEIQRELEELDFTWAQGSLYLTNSSNELAAVFKAIERLKSIDWFSKSVRDIRAFKVESWSNFTDIVKGA